MFTLKRQGQLFVSMLEHNVLSENMSDSLEFFSYGQELNCTAATEFIKNGWFSTSDQCEKVPQQMQHTYTTSTTDNTSHALDAISELLFAESTEDSPVQTRCTSGKYF